MSFDNTKFKGFNRNDAIDENEKNAEKKEFTLSIEEIRCAYLTGVPIEYTAHCQKRMGERDILRKEIQNAILTGEIIEYYPLDENNTSESSFPACLILKDDSQEAGCLHVVVGYNEKKIIVISAYRPDSSHWEEDHKTRKEK
jgi:hypothetical protein